jgi:hypothetical protein
MQRAKLFGALFVYVNNIQITWKMIHIKSDSHETWKCADQELERQISCFPYEELSDVPRLQHVHKSRRTAEESRTNATDEGNEGDHVSLLN